MNESECYFCGDATDLEDHHIVPRRLGGADTERNIVTLCRPCHVKIERLYGKRFYESLGMTDPKTTEGTHVPCDMHECVAPSIDHVTLPSVEGPVKANRCKIHLKESIIEHEIPNERYDEHFEDDWREKYETVQTVLESIESRAPIPEEQLRVRMIRFGAPVDYVYRAIEKLKEQGEIYSLDDGEGLRWSGDV